MSIAARQLEGAIAAALADPDTQAHLTKIIVERILSTMGGERPYIPKPNRNRAARNQDICEAFASGASVSEMTSKFGIGRSQIYKIIQDMASADSP